MAKLAATRAFISGAKKSSSRASWRTWAMTSRTPASSSCTSVR
jgi:hypothetical protein